MPDFRDKNTGETFSVPDSAIEDIETLRASSDFEEVTPPPMPPSAPTAMTPSKPTALEALGRGTSQGPTLGYGDELTAAAKTILDKTPLRGVKEWIQERYNALTGSTDQPEPIRGSYAENVAAERDKNLQAAAAHPVLYYGGDIATSLAIPGAALKGMAKLPLAERLAVTGLAGMGLGAVEGAGRADSPEGLISPQTLLGAEKGALVGGTVAPAGDVAISALSRAGTRTARKGAEILDPKSATLKRAQQIEESAKDLTGLAPRETLADTQKLMGQHGEKVARDLRNNIVKQIESNVNDLNISTDIIMDEAHTGLKKELAAKSIKQHTDALDHEKAKIYQNRVFQRSNKHIDAIDEVLSGIEKRAKGRTASGSAGTQSSQLRIAVDSYKKMISDKAESPYLGLGKGGIDVDYMADTYVAMDNIKRALGRAQNKIKEDVTSRDKVRDAYRDLQHYLENPKVWGEQITSAQKDLNGPWKEYLDLNPAIETMFMRTGKMSTTSGHDAFDKVGELNARKIESMLSSPNDPANAGDLETLDRWLDATGDITRSLTKHYKPTPEMAVEIEKIRVFRERILKQIENAKADFARADAVEQTAAEKALGNVDVATDRGLPLTPNARRIRELEKTRSELSDPIGRLAREKDYAKRLRSKEDELFDLDTGIIGKSRSFERGAKALMPGTSARIGSSDIVSQMWGDRPISTLADEEGMSKRDPRLESALRVRSYRQNTTNPKINNNP
jgi:hypothetical protein